MMIFTFSFNKFHTCVVFIFKLIYYSKNIANRNKNKKYN